MPRPGAWAAVAGLVDLALPSVCAGCSVGPGLLCPDCSAALEGPALLRWPDPVPAGLPPPWAVADYSGAAREAVLAHKEHGRLGLAGPLGRALARSARVAAGIDRAGPGTGRAGPGTDRVLLVPAPSRSSAVRSRGHDATTRMTRRAAAALRGEGVAATTLPVLRVRRRVDDQAGLGSAERAANLAGALQVPPRLAGLVAGRDVVLTDDVVTTGATLVEAARALTATGARVTGAALVAATLRRTPATLRRTPGLSPGSRGD